MEALECRLQRIVAGLKGLLRDTQPKALRKGSLLRLKLIGQALVRSVESELHTIRKLQCQDSDDETACTSDNEESLGGEEYRSPNNIGHDFSAGSKHLADYP